MLPEEPPVCTGLGQWNIFLFTSEFRFHLDFADGRGCVWRGRIERFHPENVIKRDRYGGGSAMIWSEISHYNDKTNVGTVNGTPNSQPYCERIVVTEVVPSLNQGQVTIFQLDTGNAGLHTARQNQPEDVLRQNNSTVLNGPGRSPDLSPFEHVWDVLGQCVRKRHNVNNVTVADLSRVL
jgi:hypothetical protein